MKKILVSITEGEQGSQDNRPHRIRIEEGTLSDVNVFVQLDCPFLSRIDNYEDRHI
jgi:hypothetical protein